MKKLILIFVLLSSLTYSQKQYINISADVRNGIAGSNATTNKPALDILILGGVTDKRGITVEIGYERFKAIGFSKTFIGLGYTFINLNKTLECTTTIEPTYIDRNWGGEYGRITYKSLGASIRLTYNISENLGVSLLENVLLRTDNAHRYDISPPKVFSTYLGITYTFKSNL